MKKPLNLRLVPIYIMIVALFTFVAAGVAVAFMVVGAEDNVLIWFIPLLAVICAAFAIAFTAYFLKMKKRFDDAFDSVLSVFSDEKTEALKELNGGEPRPEQLANWVCEQAKRNKKAASDAVVASAVNDLSEEIYWEISSERTVLDCGNYWNYTYGYNDLEKNSDIRNVLSENSRVELESAIRALKEGTSKNFSFVGDLKLTPQKNVKVNIRGLLAESEDRKRIAVGFAKDIQEQTDLYAQLESARIKENFLLSSDEDVLYEVDVPENRLYSLNPSASKELFGLSSMADFDSERRPYWKLIHPDYREGFVDRFFDYNHMMIMPEHRMIYDYKIKNKSGDYIWVQHQAQVTLARNGEVLKVIGRISNINERKNREYKNRYQSDYDSLTGSLALSALKEQFDRDIGNGEKRAIVLLNVNRFRYINNEYGFEMGDSVLKKIVISLWENQKGKCIVGRADSDTFVVGMLAVNEKDHPQSQIEKIFPKFKEPIEVDGKLINVSFCASGSSVSDEKSFDMLYSEAEKALQVCKNTQNTYENTFCIYGEDTEKALSDLELHSLTEA